MKKHSLCWRDETIIGWAKPSQAKHSHEDDRVRFGRRAATLFTSEDPASAEIFLELRFTSWLIGPKVAFIDGPFNSASNLCNLRLTL